jgi:hypothetical protein
MLERLTARSELEVGHFLATSQVGSLLPSGYHVPLEEILRRAFGGGDDELLDISLKEGSPKVFRYNLKAAAVGAISMAGSFHLGLLGIVVALAGLWQLSEIREKLSSPACVLVWILAQRGGGASLSMIEPEFTYQYKRIFGRDLGVGEFSTTLLALEGREIVRRESDSLELQELFFISGQPQANK